MQVPKFQLHIIMKLVFTSTASHLQKNSAGKPRDLFQLPKEPSKWVIPRWWSWRVQQLALMSEPTLEEAILKKNKNKCTWF